MAELNELKQDLARTVEISERYRMELLQLRLNQIKMDNVVIFSPEMKRVMRTALQLGDVDSTVLITGESGGRKGNRGPGHTPGRAWGAGTHDRHQLFRHSRGPPGKRTLRL
jgi:hypothetical protein